MFFFNKQRCRSVLIILIAALPLSTIAQDLSPNSFCPVKEFQSKQGAVKVWQQQFEDGVFDLVMAPVNQGEASTVVRLSFAGSNEPKCHFPEVSLLKGGDWGWHVAWVSAAKKAVYYVRVDGEAWVSAPPKKMVPNLAEQISLTASLQKLILSYRLINESKIKQLVSEDEGHQFSFLN